MSRVVWEGWAVARYQEDRLVMQYTDQTRACRECGREFVWTAGEQEFFASRGLQNPPSRCPECRAAAKASRSMGGRPDGERQMYEVTCSQCGQPARVPFQPRLDKPVYCSDCFSQQRAGSGAGRNRY
jgi:CxxC-x17-CxxC domain-containing protein